MQVGLKMQGDPTSELQRIERSLKQGVDAYKQLETQAMSASKALERSGADIEKLQAAANKAKAGGDTAKFAELSSALEEAKAKHTELAAASEKAARALTTQQGVVDKLANEFSDLKRQEDGAKASNENMLKASDGLSKLPGPLREVGAKTKELQEGWKALVGSLGKTKAAALVGAAAFALIAVAIVAAAVALGGYILKLGNARRDQMLTMSAMDGIGSAAGKVQQSFVGITRETGVAGERLAELTKELNAAKVPAEDMPAALKALAKQEAALGDTSGTSALIESLKDGKTSVGEMGAAMEKQFGSVARKKALGLDQQMEILKANVSDLFSGVDIEGILKGFSRLIGLLDSSTASGRAIKAIFDSMFGGLGGADKIFIGIERGILVVMTNVLKAINFVRSLGATLGMTGSRGKSSFDMMAVASGIAQAVFYSIAIAVGVVAFGIYALWSIVEGGLAVWDKLKAKASGALSGIGTWVTEAIGDLAAKLESLGMDAIAGFVKGLVSGKGAVMSTMSSVVGDAVTASKAKLDSHSPSRVMMDLGLDAGKGLEIGIDKSAVAVEDSMTALVEPPSAPKLGSDRERAAGGNHTFNIYVNDVESDPGAIADAIARELERFAGQIGAPT